LREKNKKTAQNKHICIAEEIMQLQQFFEQNPRIAVAFSGGVDSSYLLYAAKAAGCDVHAYFIKSEFQPDFELNEAINTAKSLDVPLTVGNLSVLGDTCITDNPPERCYYCKSKILDKLWILAREDGFSVLCDGTNADDDEADRAGSRAVRELGVKTPLRLCGVTKQEIRTRSRQAGVVTHDKPAYACLASRIPTGTAITKEFLEKVERSENVLFDMGFSDFRVRLIPPDTAKLQISFDQWDKAAARRDEIRKALKSDFSNIVLDLAER